MKQERLLFNKKTWFYICSRLEMTSKSLCLTIGCAHLHNYSTKWLSWTNINNLDALCISKLGANNNLFILVEESEDSLSIEDLAKEFGISKTAAKNWLSRCKYIKPITRKPRLFISFFQLARLHGINHLVHLQENNPLRLWRKSNGISLYHFEAQTGIPVKTIIEIEGAKSLDATTLAQIELACGKQLVHSLTKWHKEWHSTNKI